MNHPSRTNPFFHLPLAVCLAALTIIGALSSHAQAQSTTFTYQGRLTSSSGAPETGDYPFEFSLRDSSTGGSQVGTTISEFVTVEAGVFSVELDFGAIAYSSQDLFLQITVDNVTLTPNQPINPTPFAIDDEVGGGGGSVWEDQGNSRLVVFRDHVGINISDPAYDLHVVSNQDTDLNPIGYSAIAIGGNVGANGPGVISYRQGTSSSNPGRIKLHQHLNPDTPVGITIWGSKVGINQHTPTEALDVFGNVKCTTAIITSDRNKKAGFEPVDPREVLDKVAAMDITKWHYKSDTGTDHIGPVAQDFHEAFGLGQDNLHIATVDADGIALAAIKGLNQIVEEKDAKIESLEKRLEALEQLLVK